MTSPQGMDELNWGRDHEDVNDWAERLTMAAEVRYLNDDKMFKIAKFNLRGKVKEWFKKLNPPPADWTVLRTAIVQKFGDVDVDEICVNLDAIKQEPKEQVEKYFERLDKLFQRGRIGDIKQKIRFLAQLKLELRILCVVRTNIDIEEMVIATIEIERVLRDLGQTPCDPLREEKDEDVIKESSTDKKLSMLNETLIHFFKEFGSRNGTSVSSSRSASRCQLCQAKDHTAVACQKHNDMRPKCSKCGGGHRVENYGIRCSFCNGMGHSKDRCWRKKDTKPSNSTANYLEVLVNDEEATLNELNRICGANHHLKFGNKIPKKRLPVQANEAEGVVEQVERADAGNRTREAIFDSSARSQILLHFMKGQISLTPMETIMKIPGEREYLEGLVKLAKRRKDEEASRNQVATINITPVVTKISVNKNYRGKTMHLPMEINNGMIEGLVDTNASMLVMAANIVQELGIMHLVSRNETYKTTFGIITTTLGVLGLRFKV